MTFTNSLSPLIQISAVLHGRERGRLSFIYTLQAIYLLDSRPFSPFRSSTTVFLFLLIYPRVHTANTRAHTHAHTYTTLTNAYTHAIV